MCTISLQQTLYCTIYVHTLCTINNILSFQLGHKQALMAINADVIYVFLSPYFCFSLSGDLPYRSIPLSSIVAEVVDGYRLPIPEYATEDM